VQRSGAFEVAELLARPSKVHRRERRVVLVAEVAERPYRLLEERQCPREIAFVIGAGAEQEARVRDPPGLPERAMESERLLGPMPSSGWIACQISGDDRGAVERAGPKYLGRTRDCRSDF